MNITLKWEFPRYAGDKEAYVISEQNDGWNVLRITVDTDECNDQYAMKAMQYVIDTVNAASKGGAA